MDKLTNNQIVGNVGLFYVCYKFSRLGWNVLPTSRNAKGIDIVIYSQDAATKYTIQVKTLSKKPPVPLGKHLHRPYGDFFIVCCNAANDIPECFVLKPEEVNRLAYRGTPTLTSGTNYWLQPKEYAKDEFRENWERVGFGATTQQVHKAIANPA